MSIKIYRNISQIATLESAQRKDGRKLHHSDLGIIDNAAIAFNHDRILWVGFDEEIPKSFIAHDCLDIDMKGKVILPEIIDSHTHLLFGGNRSHEYTMRLNGETYESIAAKGGGIQYTCEITQNTSRNDLLNSAIKRIKTMKSYGVGTIEIKSGYGLTHDKEYELSHLIHDLKKIFRPDVQIINTFMAAHAIHPSFRNSSEYLRLVVMPLLEELASEKIIDAVDIFHEKNYFNKDDVNYLFNRARALGIPVKSHADELNDNHGAELAAYHQALSADHLLKISPLGIQTLKDSNTVATLLPGTSLFLGKPLAPARQMLDSGVKVAIASDFNPGSCHCDNLVLLASIAGPLYKMNIAEIWCAITLNAAAALNLKQQGALIPDWKPRFSIFNTDKIDDITYSWGKSLTFIPR